MINPYSGYVISFGIALLAYRLGWSGLYPRLSSSLLAFLFLTILLHFLLSLYWKQKIKTPNHFVAPLFRPVNVTLFIYALWTVDFIYEGGIPLIKILFNQSYNYRLFGIPSLHVFTVTFGSFYTVYLFALFISSGKRLYFILYLINLFSALLIYSRAMLIFNVVASTLVFFYLSTSVTWWRFSFLLVGFTLLIYLFGILGTLRVSFENKRTYEPGIFMDIGEASTGFRESMVPKEFFWAYIYLSSPLANLQHNINTFQVPPFSIGRLVQHINNEMLFDFVSKRMNRLFHVNRAEENTLPGKPFNVSTVYSRSFSYQGWIGMGMMAIVILIFPLLYSQILPVNTYGLTGLAILSTGYLFLFYDNTIRFTGLGLQLVYPFVLPWGEKMTTWIHHKISQ